MQFFPQVYSPQLAEVQASLDRIEAKLNMVIVQGAAMATDLSALQQEVTENGDVGASAIALLNGLAQQVRDLSTDPAALQALADQLDAQSNDLAAAVAANTVADPGGGGGGGGTEEPPPEEGGAGAPV